MFKKGLLFAGAVFLIAGIAFSSCHRWRHHHGISKERIDRMQQHLASKLDLNGEQKVKLAEIAKRFSDKVPEWSERRTRMTDTMIIEFDSEKFDAALLNAEFDSTQKQITEMKTMMVQAISDFHAILNPDQRKKLVDLMKKYQEHHKK